MVLKSLFSLASSNFRLHFGIQFLLMRVSFHYVGFIKCRESMLIALLLQIRSSSEIPGFPLESRFLTLLYRIKNSFLLLKREFIFYESLAKKKLNSPVHCFLLPLPFSLL